MHEFEISERLDKKLTKLAKKNKSQIIMIDKKIKQICLDPDRFKNLRGDLKGAKRVHIDNHFVLIFEFDKNKKIVRFLDYDHHDKIY